MSIATINCLRTYTEDQRDTWLADLWRQTQEYQKELARSNRERVTMFDDPKEGFIVIEKN